MKSKYLTLQQVQDAYSVYRPSDAPRDPAFMARKPVTRSKTRNAHPEAAIQAAIVAYLARVHPTILVSASLSGTRLAAGMMAMIRHKKQGGCTGIPDLCLVCPAGKVIWIEVKSEKGTLSDAQKYIHGKLGGLGHSIYICRSIDDVRQVMSMESVN